MEAATPSHDIPQLLAISYLETPKECNGAVNSFFLPKNRFPHLQGAISDRKGGNEMKAFLILEDGTVFEGMSIGSAREAISEIVFNTSMTGYLEVLTDPSYAGQAVAMTYPLIGNYGITPDMESARPWVEGYIVRELSRIPSNFRSKGSIQDFLQQHDIPGIAGIDTRALAKILREKGTMNGMITTDGGYNLGETLPKLKAYTTGDVVRKVTCSGISVAPLRVDHRPQISVGKG